MLAKMRSQTSLRLSFSALVHLHSRDAQGLLPDLGGVWIVAATHGPSDVGLVPLGGGPGEEAVIVIERWV